MLRPRATHVTPLPDYRLALTFDNGEHRIFDVKPYIKGSWYGKLADVNVFRKVQIGGLSVEWPDGQDLCPDQLYENSVPVK